MLRRYLIFGRRRRRFERFTILCNPPMQGPPAVLDIFSHPAQPARAISTVHYKSGILIHKLQCLDSSPGACVDIVSKLCQRPLSLPGNVDATIDCRPRIIFRSGQSRIVDQLTRE